MFYKQLIADRSPISHWTFESYSGDNTTVYGDIGPNLLNTNATLGAEGQTNHNFSGQSVNLKNGYLIVPDGTFMQNQISDNDFMITFSFKTDGNTISGSKPLISKWDPVPQFWCGFEGGNLVWKIETASAGQISLEHSNEHIIYNDYWNYVVLLAHSDGTYRFYLNGVYTGTTDTNPLQQSTLSQFTIGGVSASAFTEDIYINDIAVLNDVDYDYWPLISYRFTRSEKEAWLGHAPKYLFDFTSWFLLNPDGPVTNDGYAGGVGYVINRDDSNISLNETLVRPRMDAVRFPAGVHFTIDQDIDLDFNSGASMIIDGSNFGWMGASSFQATGDLTWNFEWIRLGESRANPDNWGFRMAFMDNGTNEVWGHQTFNATGTQIGKIGTDDGDNDAYIEFPAVGILHWKFNDIDFNVRHHDRVDLSGYDEAETDGGMGGYAPPAPLGYNRFFYRDNTGLDSGEVEWIDAKFLMLFDYEVDDTACDSMQWPKQMLFAKYFNAKLTTYYWLSGWSDTSSPEWRQQSNSIDSMLGYGNSYYSNSGLDPNANRNNDMLNAWYFPSTGYYRSQYYGTDTNNFNSNDFTFNMFIRNLNNTSKYEPFFLHYSSSYSNTTLPGGYRLGMAVNSKGRTFNEVGDFEFTTNDYDSEYTVFISQAVPDDGWHMITCVRNGVRMEVWIDGVLRGIKITPTVYNIGSSNKSMMLRGGPCYISEFMYDAYLAWGATEIEFMFRGYADVIKGQTLLNDTPIKSRLLAVDHETGHLLGAGVTEADGDFQYTLPKNEGQRMVDLIAMAYEENTTNHVVVHGPYNAMTVSSRSVDEVLDQSLDDMILDMEPLAYYPMDDTSGTTIVDQSGNGLDGTISGDYILAQEAMDIDSKAIYFGGTDAHVDLPDGFDDFTTGMTLEVWANCDTPTNHARFIDLCSAVDGIDNITFLRSALTTNLRCVMDGASSIEAADAIQDGTWEHYVFRLTPDGVASLWDSGGKVEEATGWTVGSIPNVTRTINYLGRSSFAADGYFTGYMSQVVIYDYAISDEDIYKHAFRGQGLNHPTLKGAIEADNPDVYWTFDRQQGLVDEIESITLSVNGTHVIQKNALVINDSAVGNNYLYTDQYTLNRDGNDKWAIEVSVKCPTTQTDAVVVSEWDQVANTGNIKIALMATGIITVYMNAGATAISSTATYDDGAWHHVVVNYDGDVVRLYVDGLEEAYYTIAMTYTSLNDLTIGNTSDGHTSWHLESRAEIDDLAIYGHLLDLPRIEYHYNRFQDKKGVL